MSTTPPRPIKGYHMKLQTKPTLPHPYDSEFHWVKADMIYTVGFDRLFVPCDGKDAAGKEFTTSVLFLCKTWKKYSAASCVALGWQVDLASTVVKISAVPALSVHDIRLKSIFGWPLHMRDCNPV